MRHRLRRQEGDPQPVVVLEAEHGITHLGDERAIVGRQQVIQPRAVGMFARTDMAQVGRRVVQSPAEIPFLDGTFELPPATHGIKHARSLAPGCYGSAHGRDFLVAAGP